MQCFVNYEADSRLNSLFGPTAIVIINIAELAGFNITSVLNGLEGA